MINNFLPNIEQNEKKLQAGTEVILDREIG